MLVLACEQFADCGVGRLGKLRDTIQHFIADANGAATHTFFIVGEVALERDIQVRMLAALAGAHGTTDGGQADNRSR